MPLSTPRSIEAWLTDYIRCRRRARATAMICYLVSGSIGVAICFAIADRITALPAAGRWIAFVLILLPIAAAVVIGIGSLLPWRYDRRAVAIGAESAIPALHGRLVTWVAEQTYPVQYRASGELLEAVGQEVIQTLHTTSPKRAVAYQSPRPAIWGLFGCIGLFLALVMLPRFGMLALLERQLTPWQSLMPVTTTQVTVVTGSVEVRQGASLAIVADVELARGIVELLIGTDATELQSVTMPPVTDGRYAVTLPRIERHLIYSVRAGDAVSGLYQIKTNRPDPAPDRASPTDAPATVPFTDDAADLYKRTLPTLKSVTPKP